MVDKRTGTGSREELPANFCNARRINPLDVCTVGKTKQGCAVSAVRGNFHCRSKIRVASMPAARYK